MKNRWRYLKKTVINLPYDPSIPLLGIYPEKPTILNGMCTQMFIAALFTVARAWKQNTYPSTVEYVKKLWYIYTVECYSAIKRIDLSHL